MNEAIQEHEFVVRVTQVRWEAENVVSLVLTAADGGELPRWEPGAHLEVKLPSGRIRHYSLCGPTDDRAGYSIAVLREVAGRGGSAEIHDTGLVGRELTVRGPRNHFRLTPTESYVFVAGGIGITPILSMIREVTKRGLPWRLYYGGRTGASMAFTRDLEQLAARADAQVHLLPQDTNGLLPLKTIVAEADPGAAIYVCGPAVMVSALSAAAESRPEVPLHSELFSAPEPAADGDVADPRKHARDFTVVLAQTGEHVTVASGTTILEAVRDLRPEVPYSCEEGFCGTCDTKVLDGSPIHRDTVLSEEDRATNSSMMICVGSCASRELILDL